MTGPTAPVGAPGRARVALALAGAAAAISFAAIFFKRAAPTHPLVVAGARLAIASVLLSPLTIRAWRAGRLPRPVLRRGLAAGALYGVHFGAWVTSLRLTSVASSVTLVTATPLLLGAIAIATGRDRPERRHWIAIGLASVGLSLIGWADLSLSRDALVGDGLALLGAAAMALYLLLVRGLGPRLDVLAFSGLACGVGAACLLLAAVALRVPLAVSPGSFVWIALAALIPQLVGHTLLTWSLRHATPTAVGIATVGEPVGATLLAWVWLAEAPSGLVLAGAAITLAAVLVALAGPRRAAEG